MTAFAHDRAAVAKVSHAPPPGGLRDAVGLVLAGQFAQRGDRAARAYPIDLVHNTPRALDASSVDDERRALGGEAPRHRLADILLVPGTSARMPSSFKSSVPSLVATTTHAEKVMSPSGVPINHQEVIRRALFHGVGAALMAVFSYETARRIPFMPEAYLAAIAAVVSLYPERDATMTAGIQQFFGSAVGGLIGWASASWWHHNVALYGAASCSR